MPPIEKIYAVYYEHAHQRLQIYVFGWADQNLVGNAAKVFLEKIKQDGRYTKYSAADGEFWLEMTLVMGPKDSDIGSLVFQRFTEIQGMDDVPDGLIEFVREYLKLYR